MKHLVGSIVATLALLLGNTIAVAEVQEDSTPAATAVTETTPVLDGTSWAGTDSNGDYAEFTFLKGGHLRVRSPELMGTKLETTENKGDTWVQDGAAVKFLENGVVHYVGTIAGDRITGTASNPEGEHWTWDVKRMTATTEPWSPGPKGPIPAGLPEVIEITLEADRHYSWHGRIWRAGELKGQLIQESHLHPIGEVRLLAPPGKMSIANVIDVTQMGQAVGAKPSFDENGKPGEIIVNPPPDSANTTQVEFAGRTLTLPVPAGVCVVPKDSEQGVKLYKMQAESSKGTAKIAAAFADCAVLAKREHDPKVRISNFGEYAIPLMEGKEAVFPPEITLAAYIKAAVEGADVATVEKAADQKLQDFTAKPSPDGSLRLGPISYDENAMYIGMITPVKAGEDAKLCVVVGVTIVNQVPVTMMLYSEYADATSIHSLLAKQKINLKALIDANRK